MDILTNLFSLLFLPLGTSILIIDLGKYRKQYASIVAFVSALGALSLSYVLLKNLPGSVHFSWEWLAFGDSKFYIGILLDNIGATMLAMVSIVSLCIVTFSIGYMSDDAAKGRFFAGVAFFMFSMSGIILADNLIIIFLFWELVGFSSYLLIGHYFQN